MAMSFGTVMSAGLNPAAAPEPNMGALGITMILGLVMLIYTIVLLVFYCLPGTPGPMASSLELLRRRPKASSSKHVC